MVVGVAPVDEGWEGGLAASVAVDQNQVGMAVMVQVAGLQADRAETLQFQTMAGVEALGTVPVDVGVDIIGTAVLLVGKGQVDPAVAVEVPEGGRRRMQGGKLQHFLGRGAGGAPPIEIGELPLPVGEDQVGKSIPIEVGHAGCGCTLGRVLAPGLVFEALGAAPADLGPVVPVGYRQIEGAIPVQVGQLGAQQISPVVDLAAGLRKPFGASPIEIETLFLGVVVEEKQFRIAVVVQVSGFAVHGADAGDGASTLGGEPGGAVPVDVGFQVVGVSVALTALGAVVGKGQVQVAVPVEIGGFHVGGHQGGQLGAPVRPITLRASPVDQGLHMDRVVVDEIAEDNLQVAVPVEIGQQRRSPSIGGEPGDAAVPGANFPQQLAQRLLVGKGRQNRPGPLGGSPVDQEVFVLQLVVVLGHEESR